MTTMQKLVQTVAALSGGADADAAMMVSTSSPDREGDRVLAEGVDLTNFQKNSPLLWAHDARSLPIGAVTSVEVLGHGLRAAWRWLRGDPFADRVARAWDQGVVRAASIGFAPRTSEPNAWGGRDFTSWELYEVSLVPIGANAEAVRALKALKLWSDDDDRDPAVARYAEIAKAWLGGPTVRRSESTGIIITDPHRLAAVSRGNERVSFDEADLKTAWARVITAAMVEPLQRARQRVTGRID
jgi:HK97 family phage prohead protease